MSRGKACWATARGPLAAAGTSLSHKDPRGVTEKLRERLSGACPQSGKFCKTRVALRGGSQGEAVSILSLEEEHIERLRTWGPEPSWPRSSSTSAAYELCNPGTSLRGED